MMPMVAMAAMMLGAAVADGRDRREDAGEMLPLLKRHEIQVLLSVGMSATSIAERVVGVSVKTVERVRSEPRCGYDARGDGGMEFPAFLAVLAAEVRNATERELESCLADRRYAQERRICELVCESLQVRDEERLVVVNEACCGAGGAADLRADLKVYLAPGPRSPTWVEVKPLLEGSNYWNSSKFFKGDVPSTDVHHAASVILDDIDKSAGYRAHEKAGSVGFAFVLILHVGVDGASVRPDPCAPRPRTRLTPGQVLHLSLLRFRRAMRCDPVETRSFSERFGFDVIVMGAPLHPRRE